MWKQGCHFQSCTASSTQHVSSLIKRLCGTEAHMGDIRNNKLSSHCVQMFLSNSWAIFFCMYILVIASGLVWSSLESWESHGWGHQNQVVRLQIFGKRKIKTDFSNDGRVDLWLTKYVLVMEKSTVLNKNYYLYVRGLHTAFLIQTDFSVYISSISLQDTVHRLFLYFFCYA